MLCLWPTLHAEIDGVTTKGIFKEKQLAAAYPEQNHTGTRSGSAAEQKARNQSPVDEGLAEIKQLLTVMSRKLHDKVFRETNRKLIENYLRINSCQN